VVFGVCFVCLGLGLGLNAHKLEGRFGMHEHWLWDTGWAWMNGLML